MNDERLFSLYEWEVFEAPITFEGCFSCINTCAPYEIEQNIQLLHVCRDEKYNIQVKAEGKLSDSNVKYEEKTVAGALVTGGTIVCDTSYKGKVTLKYCINEGYTLHHKTKSDSETKFEAAFRVYEINWDRHLGADGIATDTLIEWYLNGIDSTNLFCDGSSVSDEVSRIITRAGDTAHNLCNSRKSFLNDCVYLALGDTGVLIRKVLPEYGPKWSNNIALEYRSSYGRIPDKEEREKIAELISFLIGRHLILIGDTEYHKNDIIEVNMYHPHSLNAVAECNSNTKEIVPVHQYHNERENFRRYVQALWPMYFKIRDLYDINSVLERYWLANTMPIGVNLPILAGALESMMKVWFKQQRSKTKGVYIEAKKYEKIINDFKLQIGEALEGCEYKTRILNKISNAYQMGANERYFVFLEELGLEYGTAEKNCIKERNSFTHGDNGRDEWDTLQNTRTMFILIGRIILKLLEYDGEYIDETLPGFLRKGINDKIN